MKNLQPSVLHLTYAFNHTLQYGVSRALQSLLSHHTKVSILQLPKQLLKRNCQIAVHTRAHVVAGALMVKPVDPPRYISHKHCKINSSLDLKAKSVYF